MRRVRFLFLVFLLIGLAVPSAGINETYFRFRFEEFRPGMTQGEVRRLFRQPDRIVYRGLDGDIWEYDREQAYPYDRYWILFDSDQRVSDWGYRVYFYGVSPRGLNTPERVVNNEELFSTLAGEAVYATLSWEGGLDLDLYVYDQGNPSRQIPASVLGCADIGAMGQGLEYVIFDEAARRGFEGFDFSRGEWTLVVRNYRGPEPEAVAASEGAVEPEAAEAVVAVHLADGSVEEFRWRITRQIPLWVVCRIDLEEGSVEAVELVEDEVISD